MGFPGGSDGKESACNAGDLGLIPGLGRSPGEGNGNLLQYSFFFNSPVVFVFVFLFCCFQTVFFPFLFFNFKFIYFN